MRNAQGGAPRKFVILLAEDDRDDVFFATDALNDANINHDLRRVADGDELMDYLHGRAGFASLGAAPRPDLILMDLNMPGKDGREALEEIKSDPRLRQIPVVVLSTSSDSVDIADSYDRGANSYLVKPRDYRGWVEMMRAVDRFWFAQAHLASR